MPGRAPEGRGVRGLHLLLCKVGRASSLISAPTLWRSDEALRTHAERVPRIWVSHTAQPRTPEAPMQERSRSRHTWKGPTSATRARRNNTLHAVSQEEPFRESRAVPLQTRQQMPARAFERPLRAASCNSLLGNPPSNPYLRLSGYALPAQTALVDRPQQCGKHHSHSWPAASHTLCSRDPSVSGALEAIVY